MSVARKAERQEGRETALGLGHRGLPRAVGGKDLRRAHRALSLARPREPRLSIEHHAAAAKAPGREGATLAHGRRTERVRGEAQLEDLPRRVRCCCCPPRRLRWNAVTCGGLSLAALLPNRAVFDQDGGFRLDPVLPERAPRLDSIPRSRKGCLCLSGWAPSC